MKESGANETLRIRESKGAQTVLRAAVVIDRTLDCTGLFCPMPIIKTQQAMAALVPGLVLEVIATDPGSVADMQAWARETGHELLGYRPESERFRFLIRKGK
jgi:TusA-related sulfurtransferase